MLTAVKNQGKVTLLNIKYALMREMLNKTTFITNIVFMVLNNASFIIQWLILYSIKDNVGGYTFKEVMLLWGIAAGTYGVSHFFFEKAYTLADTITEGKLDVFLVQPKNVLLSAITSDVKTSALGDILYGFIMCFVANLTITQVFLFLFFCIMGGIVLTCVAVILGSLSFWFQKADMVADTGNGLMTNFATYPDGIFKGFVKVLLFTIVPVGLVNYIPIKVLTNFRLDFFFLIVGTLILFLILAFVIFYRGLRRYSSSNLMNARI